MSEPHGNQETLTGNGYVSFGTDALDSTPVSAPLPDVGRMPSAPLDPAPTAVADPVPTAVPESAGSVANEVLTCPACGTVAQVTVNRRDAADFCRVCDYPLFWTPSTVYRDLSGTDESLRRLPGTEGRATIASLPCPHCAELNTLSAQVCVRCGRSIHPVAEAPPPPPAPVYVPEPVFVPEPKARTPWWVWLLLGVVLVALVTLGILYATDVIG